jgi:maltooligosyltrehalose trehalohydrolase
VTTEPFGCWAPHARRVELELGRGDGARRVSCVSGDRGWWSWPGPDDGDAAEALRALGPTPEYRFVLDGYALPDPRSPWQPDGVDGPSRRDDPGAFPWSDRSWRGFQLPAAVVSELHVGTFTPAGTFDGVVERLDDLVELGVTAIELMPVAEFPGRRGWGYDGVLLGAPHHAYGGPDGLRRLVDAAHARGIGVVLDVVFNHLGPSGNHLGRYGPYFTDTYATPWGDAVNLDGPGSDDVRRFICDTALHWLRDHHIDGLRLDAVHAFHDHSAVHLLEQLAEEVDELAGHLGRELVLIAESDLNDPRLVRSRDAGGHGLDAAWSDDLHHALHAALTGERDGYYADFGSLDDVVTALTHVFVYSGRWSEYRQRRHGRPVGALPAHRFLGYAQDHDQIGNRARGERLVHLVGPELAAVAAAVVLCGPCTPMLFQGEEWGASAPFPYFTDHTDPALADAVREGRRREFAEFGWDPADVPDPQDPATAASAVLDWDERTRAPHRELLDWHRSLIALRRAMPALTDGRLDRVRARADDAERWLVMERGPVMLVANLADVEREVAVSAGRPPAQVLGSVDGVAAGDGWARLPPRATAVLVAR